MHALKQKSIAIFTCLSLIVGVFFVPQEVSAYRSAHRDCSANTPPVAVMSKAERMVRVGDKVKLSAEKSYDPEHDRLNFYWTVYAPDGTQFVEVGENLKFKPQQTGQYIVTMVANDACGNWDVAWTALEAQERKNVCWKNEAPTPVIDPIEPTIYEGESVTLDASKSYDDEEGSVLGYFWEVHALGIQSTDTILEFTPPSAGDYIVTLVANDACGKWQVTWTTVHVVENPTLKPDLLLVSAELGVLEAGGKFFPGVTPTEGTLPAYKVRIQNIGTAESGSWQFGMRYPGTISNTSGFPSILPGGVYTTVLGVTARTAGQYEVTLSVDPENLIDELNESNNTIVKTLIVEPAPKPDLDPAVLLLLNQSREQGDGFYPGDSILVRWTARNIIGNVHSGEFKSTIDIDNGLVKFTETQPSLMPTSSGGASIKDYSTLITWPDAIRTEVTVSVTLDPDNQIDELDENNNTVTKIFGPVAKPDLNILGTVSQ